MKLKHDYRVAQSSIAKVKPEDRPWAVIEEIWDAYAACPAAQESTFLKRLTPGQRAFVALNGLVAEVENGGVHQFLWNSTGNLFHDALAGLELVGARDHVRLLRKVERLFPEPRLLRSRKDRQEALRRIKPQYTNRIFDDPFGTLEARKRTSLPTLRRAYLEKHPEEFYLPAGQTEERIPLPVPGGRDYRVAKTSAARLRGEQLHWKLIAPLWDDYWEVLKAGRQPMLDFLPSLSKGQRAFIAVDILDKIILRIPAGFRHFLADQIGADILVGEVSHAYNLLRAKPYADLFRRGLVVGGRLPDLNRRVSDSSRKVSTAKKNHDEAAVQEARRAFRSAYDETRAAADACDEQLEALTDKFKALLGKQGQPIEPYLEAYFDAHLEEFVR